MRVTECLANAERTPTEYELEIPMQGFSLGLAKIRASDLVTVRAQYDRWRADKDRPADANSKRRHNRLATRMESLTYDRYLYSY